MPSPWARRIFYSGGRRLAGVRQCRQGCREKDGEKEPGPDLSEINWDFIPFSSLRLDGDPSRDKVHERVERFA